MTRTIGIVALAAGAWIATQNPQQPPVFRSATKAALRPTFYAFSLLDERSESFGLTQCPRC